MANSLALTLISLILGLFFIFLGLVKVTPYLSQDIHKHMQSEFGRYNKVFPLYSLTNWRPYAKNYRIAVGWIEVAIGVLFAFIPGAIKELATFASMTVMAGAFYTHWALNDPVDNLVPAFVFTLLILTRMVIRGQANERERSSRPVTATETKKSE